MEAGGGGGKHVPGLALRAGQAQPPVEVASWAGLRLWPTGPRERTGHVGAPKSIPVILDECLALYSFGSRPSGVCPAKGPSLGENLEGRGQQDAGEKSKRNPCSRPGPTGCRCQTRGSGSPKQHRVPSSEAGGRSSATPSNLSSVSPWQRQHRPQTAGSGRAHAALRSPQSLPESAALLDLSLCLVSSGSLGEALRRQNRADTRKGLPRGVGNQAGLVPAAPEPPVLSLSHPAGAERDQHLITPSAPAAAAGTPGQRTAGDIEEPGRPQASSTRRHPLKPGWASFQSLNR